MGTTQLLNWEVEWRLVISFLGVGDVVTLSQTCNFLNRLCSEPLLWKNLLEEHLKPFLTLDLLPSSNHLPDHPKAQFLQLSKEGQLILKPHFEVMKKLNKKEAQEGRSQSSTPIPQVPFVLKQLVYSQIESFANWDFYPSFRFALLPIQSVYIETWHIGLDGYGPFGSTYHYPDPERQNVAVFGEWAHSEGVSMVGLCFQGSKRGQVLICEVGYWGSYVSEEGTFLTFLIAQGEVLSSLSEPKRRSPNSLYF